MDLKQKIRLIDGFPHPGINFKDITTLLKDPGAYHELLTDMARWCGERRADLVVGPEARGFVMGAPIAYILNAGFIPIRKPGKLPGPTHRYEYKLEYGGDIFEMHQDSIQEGQRVIIVDDLLATGGTALAAAHLIKRVGGEVVGFCFAVELSDLHGREALKDYDVYTTIVY